MRTPLVAGNWKMNGSGDSVAELLAGITDGVNGLEGVEVLVCPPFLYIPQAREAIAGSAVALGAQNLYAEAGGAYTGEISGSMLRDAGCSYVIVGHSERRALMGETDGGVAHKFMMAQENGLTPILCVGETLEERQNDSTLTVIG
ncbi:MAG: triose-phosphate isomerase, partial [Gammaproteobacteria bacterium]|nr:triose-phosphate isomerase [Gammaproteobacteria bacterium]